MPGAASGAASANADLRFNVFGVDCAVLYLSFNVFGVDCAVFIGGKDLASIPTVVMNKC